MDVLRERTPPLDPTRVKVIACATVIEEMRPWMPSSMDSEVLDFGLHLHPGSLTDALQAAIDGSTGYDVLLLGYGLCSRGVIGLRATTATLVLPRVDDCIAIFLGSREAYEGQVRGEPGTYYLTKGWIEVGDTPFDEFERLVVRYGRAKAERILARMLAHYTRLAFINTGTDEGGRYRARAEEIATRFGLRFETIPGAPTLVRKLLEGPWDEDCVVVPRGGVVGPEAFSRSWGAAG